MSKLKKGDTVQVLSGKNVGKQGKILRLLPERDCALVEGVNLLTHFERRAQNQPGGMIKKEGPIKLAKLGIVCAKCNKPARIGWSVKGSTKTRVCRRCDEVLNG